MFTKEDLTEVRSPLLLPKMPAAARAAARTPCEGVVQLEHGF